MSKASRPTAQLLEYSASRRRFLTNGASSAFGLAAARSGFSFSGQRSSSGAAGANPLAGSLAGLPPGGAPLGYSAAAKSRVVWSGPGRRGRRRQVRDPPPPSTRQRDHNLLRALAAADSWEEVDRRRGRRRAQDQHARARGIKGMDYTRHFAAVTPPSRRASAKRAIEDKNIVVWDRSEEELDQAGLTIQKEPGSMRFIATKVGRRDAGE